MDENIQKTYIYIMKFNNKIIKLLIRFTKENNHYQEFKKLYKKSKIKNEKELINFSYKTSPLFALYTLGITNEKNKFISPSQKFIFEQYKTEIINLFENFLKKNKAYTAFFKNVDKHFVTEHYINYVIKCGLFKIPKINNKKELIYNVLTPMAFVGYSFEWVKTKQGLALWNDINTNWIRQYLEFIDNIK